MLIGSLIPYIESHYRVKTEKKYRAIGGLSMGSYQTNDIGFRHPELFEYMGQFTAGITQDPNKWTYERKYKEAISNPKEFEKNYKYFSDQQHQMKIILSFLKRMTEYMKMPV